MRATTRRCCRASSSSSSSSSSFFSTCSWTGARRSSRVRPSSSLVRATLLLGTRSAIPGAPARRRSYSAWRTNTPPGEGGQQHHAVYRPSWGVRLLALTIAATSTFYLSRSAWLNALGDEPAYGLDRIRNDKRSVVFSDDYDQNWWGFERFLPSPLSVQDRYYHRELAEKLVERGAILQNQFIMPEIPTKQELQLYNSPDYLGSLCRSRFLAQALDNAALRFFPSLIIHTFISGFMLEAVGGTALATRVALTRGWSINLGGGFHYASSTTGSRGCLFNDVSLAIKLARSHEKERIQRVLIIDLTSTPGDGFVRDFALDKDVYLIDTHSTKSLSESTTGMRVLNGATLAVPTQGMTKETYLQWVSKEVNKAITTFQPQLVYYVSGSAGPDDQQASWIPDRDALVFRLAVDMHAVPLVMVVSGGWLPGNDPSVMAESIANILAHR